MYPAETYSSVSRRPLDVEDYVDILRRHKGWIFGPAFAGLVIAVVVAFLWPDTYVSRAVIRVVPPQVPENLVPTNVTTAISHRVNSMYQTISSRSNLTNLVNIFNLYPKERQRKPIEDIIEDMKGDIGITPVVSLAGGSEAERKGISAFAISFAYSDRLIAQKVTADLVSRFMSENARERQQQSLQTTQFLRDQVDQARKELEAIEDKLAKFRMNAQGRLPDQVSHNQMQLNGIEQRIANVNAAISRVQQEKMLLESDLRNFKNQLASLTPPPDQVAQQQKNERLVQVDREIQQLETALANLRENYKDTYPDVRRVKAQLTTAQATRARIVEEEAAKPDKPAAAKKFDPMFERESRMLESSIDRAEAMIRSKDAQLQEYQQELAKAEKQVRVVQTRIESMPISEQQYLEVIRDRELAKQKYDDLNRRRSQSSIAEDLEKRQQGETLEVLDSASLPQTPTEPKRPMIIGMGFGLGLILGLVMAGAREAKDTSLKNLKDVRAYTQLTILGSVPLLENDLVVRRRRRLGWLAWSTACLIGIVIMTGAVFYYYATKV